VQIAKKFLKLGTGTGELNSRDVPANYTPSEYSPSQVATEGNDKVSAHLKGINTRLGEIAPTTDIELTSFSAANNQAAAANITGLLLNGSNSFICTLSVALVATASKYAVYSLYGVYDGSTWIMSQEYSGQDTGLVFSITSGGQVQYTSPNSAGFVSNTLRFRAITT